MKPSNATAAIRFVLYCKRLQKGQRAGQPAKTFRHRAKRYLERENISPAARYIPSREPAMRNSVTGHFRGGAAGKSYQVGKPNHLPSPAHPNNPRKPASPTAVQGKGRLYTLGPMVSPMSRLRSGRRDKKLDEIQPPQLSSFLFKCHNDILKGKSAQIPRQGPPSYGAGIIGGNVSRQKDSALYLMLRPTRKKNRRCFLSPHRQPEKKQHRPRTADSGRGSPAVLGAAKSLHTNSRDEALALSHPKTPADHRPSATPAKSSPTKNRAVANTVRTPVSTAFLKHRILTTGK